MFRVRRTNAGDSYTDLFVDIPRNRTVEKLRDYIQKEWDIPPEDQRLYYKGKELNDKHILIEYNIQRNNIVHLFIRQKIVETASNCEQETSSEVTEEVLEEDVKEIWTTAQSNYYKVGDPIDIRLDDLCWNGAWFEGEIVEILKNPDLPNADKEENLKFVCKVPRYDYMKPFNRTFEVIRPRSHYTYAFAELKEGIKALACVNVDEPTQRGLWYDVEIKKISKKKIEAAAFIGIACVDVNLHFVNELMRIEEPILLSERKGDLPIPPIRKYPADCLSCRDKKDKKCKRCGCHTCGEKDRPELLLLCDECDMGFHISCLVPPLESLPKEEHWYCPDCKTDENEIVKAGERLKTTKRSKMPALKENSTRDWDNGMACVGRSKECTIVPKNHFGPIPGVDVGTLWKYRAQVSEAGIHRPLVAGIHGRSDEGAYSIVVSGGYEDDVDNGEEFEYTGAGGRDLSGNKRVNDQTCDQKLEQTNKALALCCAAKFNKVTGATAENWKKGKPVRVVRKHGKSQYAPEDGYRYDGIYKVIKYYPEKGKSGFIVWKFILRRDDPSPPPWTADTPPFDMIYPPEYVEYEAFKRQRKAEKALATKKSPKKIKNNKKGVNSPQTGDKRKQTSILDYQGVSKKPKIQNKFTLSTECTQWIEEDGANKKLWDDCCSKLPDGKMKFLEYIMETFLCICCRELVNAPVTLPCNHNVCKGCLKRSFNMELYFCPNCRHELGKNFKMTVNETLFNILKTLFPGYEKDS